jgi:myo-inositol-1(or 4)-monophosphatase
MHRIAQVLSACHTQEQATLLQAACRAALTAGSIIRQLYDKPHQIEMKGVINLVTEADLAAESAILASLDEDAPGITVLAEESSGEKITCPSGKTWVVDPLDGTTNFAHGLPVFAVSVALLDAGKPTVGAVYCPMQDELFCAAKSSGAWLNGKQIKVTDTQFLIESLVATGFPYNIHDNMDEILYHLQAVLPKVRDIRRAGAAAVDLAWLACGRLDGFWEMELKPWDTAAGWLLVTEAGGRLSDFGGADYSCFGRETLASNGRLHDELIKLLAGA